MTNKLLAMLRWVVMVLGHKQYDSGAPGCRLWGAHSWTCSSFLAKGHTGKEVARFDLAALFGFQGPVTENFNGNLAEVFRSSAAHDSK